LKPIAPKEFQAADLRVIFFGEYAKQRFARLTLFSQAARGIAFTRTN
jgi:hypothetical protein